MFDVLNLKTRNMYIRKAILVRWKKLRRKLTAF